MRWDEPNLDRNDRLFFGILVESAIADALASRAIAWQRELGLGGKLVRARHLHISLLMLGDHDGLPKPLVDAACRAGSLVRAQAFDVTFDRLSAFGGGALVLRGNNGIPPLQAFWRALASVLSDSPLKPYVPNSIEPHVTLLRDKASVAKVDERSIEPIGWTVREFVLMHSFLRKDRYQVCGRWQLGGKDDALAAM
ncbi:2'-5' RNA ligase family protein [Mesorhizobium sp.]|uniref:2'-5' RNA ligase family protein n=1 Tax=Mesorhizobium sp. TaxID=1871066 RepID=UPI0025C3F4C5|nr:2'-5' RNA ligase family protein [Mesorhizobium sp.]